MQGDTYLPIINIGVKDFQPPRLCKGILPPYCLAHSKTAFNPHACARGYHQGFSRPTRTHTFNPHACARGYVQEQTCHTVPCTFNPHACARGCISTMEFAQAVMLSTPTPVQGEQSSAKGIYVTLNPFQPFFLQGI